MDRTVPRRPFTKPVRIPETVVVQTVSPAVARAGEHGRWRLPFVLSEAIPGGTAMELLLYGGRNVKGVWRPLQAEFPDQAGFVTLCRAEESEPVATLSGSRGGSFAFQAPDGGFAEGTRLTADLGGEKGCMAPLLSQPDKMFLLVLPQPATASTVPETNAEPAKRIVAACLIQVTGTQLHHLRLYAPSQTRVAEPFTILVRPEDKFDNVASARPGRLRLFRDETELHGWERVDLPYSACCRLEGVSLRTGGIARLRVVCDEPGLGGQSNPVCCNATGELGTAPVFWGMIHGHTENSDGTASLAHYYTYMRDQCALDFGAAADHDHVFETSPAMWKASQAAAVQYNEPGRFVTLLAYEWAKWRQNGDGDRNVYYLEDRRPMYRSDDGHYPSPPDLFRALAAETAMVIPHHPAELGNHCDYKDHDPVKERLVEIYSVWGSSECSVHEGNPFPVRPVAQTPGNSEARDAGEVADGFVQRALRLGWRVGFTAGGDDHHGHPGDEVRHGTPPWLYKAGLLAVQAPAKTREALWAGLWQRRCYATTGARLRIDFRLNAFPMGTELTLASEPGLASERNLTLVVNGTAPVACVEILRNNEVVFMQDGDGDDVLVSWCDREAFADVALPPTEFCKTPFCFYYARVRQTDGEMAWVSPVWVA